MNSHSETALLLGPELNGKITKSLGMTLESSEASLSDPVNYQTYTKSAKKEAKTWAKTIVFLIALLVFFLFVLLLMRSHQAQPSEQTNSFLPFSALELQTNPGYTLRSLSQDAYSIKAKAKLRSPSELSSTENPSTRNIQLASKLLRPNHFEIKITDPKKDRFEVPSEFPFPAYSESAHPIPWKSSPGMLAIPDKNGDPFKFDVSRKETNETIFSSNSTLIYTKYYLEFTSRLPRGYLYGLGERTGPFQLTTGTYTLWNKDSPGTLDNGTTGTQTYGYHPMYLIREDSGNFSLVFFRSSNAMDVIIQSESQEITFKIAGEGILDIHVLIGGGNPETLIKQYHEYIRKWQMPPFWSLGWHQCRWGYTSIDMVEAVLSNYSFFRIPLDVIWTDIDYMHNYIDFTIDESRFPIDRFNSVLERFKKRWVPIIDAGIGLKDDTYAIQQIEKLDIAIKNPGGKGNLVGSVWPGDVYYVDYWNPKSENFWKEMLETLYSKVKFSGIWLDMNELSNFCNGVCNPNIPLTPVLPYSPGGSSLSDKTVDIGAVHYNGFTELNVHTYSGYLESKATHNFLKQKSPLTFILSRSTAYGSGQFANHWTGDNVATVEFLKYSISGIMSFNLYGIPLTGSDICGFSGEADELLCARWHQVGAWYPFARNHHEIHSRAQEPYAFGTNSTMLRTTLAALRYRYAHLRFYYTQFLLGNGTGTVFRPLFFEWPHDELLFEASSGYNEKQFMIGDSLMICPSFNPVEIDEFMAYFPAGRWFDYKSGFLVTPDKNTGTTVKVKSKLNDTAPVYLRGGKIVFAEFSSAENVNNTEDLANRFTMTVGLQKASSHDLLTASGKIMGSKNISDNFLMDECILNDCMIGATAKGDERQLQVTFEANSTRSSITIDEIRIWGLDIGTKSDSANLRVSVSVNGKIKNNYSPKVRENDALELTGVYIKIRKYPTTLNFEFNH